MTARWIWGGVGALLLATALLPGPMLGYGVWLIWAGFVLWLAWRVTPAIPVRGHPYIGFLRRVALGTVILTLVNLPLIYAIATMQTSVFGGGGPALAEPSVLLMTVVLVAPGVFLPLVAVRAAILGLRAPREGETAG